MMPADIPAVQVQAAFEWRNRQSPLPTTSQQVGLMNGPHDVTTSSSPRQAALQGGNEVAGSSSDPRHLPANRAAALRLGAYEVCGEWAELFAVLRRFCGGD